MFKTVLFPIDRSREAREAAKVVSNIVRTYNSRLVVLSVIETQGDSGMYPDSEVAKLLQGAKTLFSQQGITAETLEKVGGVPSFTICDVADEIKADLIIMGSRGLDLASGNAKESVSHRAIDLAPCPVLIVP